MEQLRVSNKKGRSITVQKNSDYLLLETAKIICFYRSSSGGTAVVYEDKIKYTYNKNLTEIENFIDPTLFFRANRQFIININFIKGFQRFEKVKFLVKLKFVKNKIIISQFSAQDFKRWIHQICI
jgi:DNA-binding LytR/AlgR family response regulator